MACADFFSFKIAPCEAEVHEWASLVFLLIVLLFDLFQQFLHFIYVLQRIVDVEIELRHAAQLVPDTAVSPFDLPAFFLYVFKRFHRVIHLEQAEINAGIKRSGVIFTEEIDTMPPSIIDSPRRWKISFNSFPVPPPLVSVFSFYHGNLRFIGVKVLTLCVYYRLLFINPHRV